MDQVGNISNKNIRAWALGSVSGYTFEKVTLKPRLGFQFDAASGTHNFQSNTIGTFNPLFPNGEYFTLLAYTGYVNFIHIKPSITFRPAPPLSTTLAFAGQWRETTADAVYVVPNIPIQGTAGMPGRYTGNYFQGRIDWQMNPYIHNAIEVVQFTVSDAIRKAGGHNSTYIGVETKLGW